MENTPPRRKPLPKLKFPLLGGSFTGGTESDINRKYFMYLFGAIVAFVIGYEYLNSKKASTILKASKLIESVEWKGKVAKKYMGYDRPDFNMFDLVEANNKISQVDISADSSQFFDQLMPRDSVYKTKNSLKVRVKNYIKDTTYTLQFPK
jgi:hypothetical protein